MRPITERGIIASVLASICRLCCCWCCFIAKRNEHQRDEETYRQFSVGERALVSSSQPKLIQHPREVRNRNKDPIVHVGVSSISEEVFLRILTFLAPSDLLLGVALVNREWNKRSRQDLVWREVCQHSINKSDQEQIACFEALLAKEKMASAPAQPHSSLSSSFWSFWNTKYIAKLNNNNNNNNNSNDHIVNWLGFYREYIHEPTRHWRFLQEPWGSLVMVVLLGDERTGKSSYCSLITGEQTQPKYKPTIRLESRTFSMEDTRSKCFYKIRLFEYPGKTNYFSSIPHSCIRGSTIMLLFYNPTIEATLTRAQQIYDDMNTAIDYEGGFIFFLVACTIQKIERPDDKRLRKTLEAKGRAWAKEQYITKWQKVRFACVDIIRRQGVQALMCRALHALEQDLSNTIDYGHCSDF